MPFLWRICCYAAKPAKVLPPPFSGPPTDPDQHQPSPTHLRRPWWLAWGAFFADAILHLPQHCIQAELVSDMRPSNVNTAVTGTPNQLLRWKDANPCVREWDFKKVWVVHPTACLETTLVGCARFVRRNGEHTQWVFLPHPSSFSLLWCAVSGEADAQHDSCNYGNWPNKQHLYPTPAAYSS